jgi:RHS repeat-associated protein
LSTTILGGHYYGYDGASSRLLNVTNVIATANRTAYNYVANSSLIDQITFRQNTTDRMTTTRQHDRLNRLESISSASSGEPLPLAYNYVYNNALPREIGRVELPFHARHCAGCALAVEGLYGVVSHGASQRVRTTLADGSFWIYEYDSLGQVRSGKRFWSDGTPMAGQQFEYAHDDIGNRTSAKKGGDQNGANLRTGTYSVNNLNQYTSRTNPGFLEVLGLANPSAGLSVSGTGSALYRRGEYFRRELSVSNSGGPVYQTSTITATLGTQDQETVGDYVPRSSETFAYDTDGNLTSDSLWDYTWDGENRLIEMAMKTGTGISGTTRKRMLFDYDWMGRRIQKRAYYHDGGSGWTLQYTRKFLYDGWNLIAELNGSNVRVRTYVWGTDLSGSHQGAGGVGGLLMVRQHEGTISDHFVAYDGNGNIMGLVNAADGKYSARYEYGPFGEPIRVSAVGSSLMAKNNPFRFSTKYTDDDSGFLYYGYRYYDPSTGRWPNRDPIEEDGGENLFAAFENDATNRYDMLGLHSFGLEFWSEGRAFKDPWTARQWKFESGGRDSANAWYLQRVSGKARQGICNSGGPRSGSFVHATVTSTYPCCMLVRISCEYKFRASMHSFTDSFATVNLNRRGHLLGQAVSGFQATTSDGGVTWLSFSRQESHTRVVKLLPGKPFEMYRIQPSVAGFRNVRGHFAEHLDARCSADVLAPCR